MYGGSQTRKNCQVALIEHTVARRIQNWRPLIKRQTKCQVDSELTDLELFAEGQ
jgi:hypothetical protein